MKEKLEAMRQKKLARKAEIKQSINSAENIDQVRSLSVELDGVEAELREIEDMIAEIPPEQPPVADRTLFVNSIPPIVIPPNPASTRDAQPQWVYTALGEQLRDIRSAAMGHGIPTKLEQHINQMRSLGLNESEGGEGGFTIQPDFVQGMFETAVESSPVLSLVTRKEVSANANEAFIPVIDEPDISDDSVFGGVKAYYVEEGQTITPSQPKFKQLRVPLKKLVCLTYITDEMMQDSTLAGSLINTAFAEAIDRKTSDMIISDLIAATGTVEVAKEASQAADTVTAKNLLKMKASMMVKNRAKAVWLMNPDVAAILPELYISGAHSDNFIYMPSNGISGSSYDSLFNRPVIDTDLCKTLGDKGDILFADLSKYLLLVKSAIQMASSIHVQFLTDQQAFRAIFRNGGIPLRQSTLTIKNSSTKLSSYVTLAERA